MQWGGEGILRMNGEEVGIKRRKSNQNWNAHSKEKNTAYEREGRRGKEEVVENNGGSGRTIYFRGRDAANHASRVGYWHAQ